MRFFFMLLLADILLIAKSLYLSDLPLPKTYIINLETEKCSTKCLDNYLKNGKVFSFLSNYKSSDSNFLKKYEAYKIQFNLANTKNFQIVKIALMIPKNIIGRYSISCSKSVLSYLLSRDIDFDFEVFDSKNESAKNLKQTVDKIEKRGYHYVIGIYTDKGVKNLLKLDSNLIFYISTINKNEIKSNNSNVIFGGIDYKRQIDKLLKYSNDRIAIFSDQSRIGYKLSSYIEQSNNKIVYKKIIAPKTTKFRAFLKHNTKLNNSSIFLNTTLVKSSLLASQFRYYKIRPYAIFSTQINYNPLLLNLTQYGDRKDMYIANSINAKDKKLIAINKIFDNDIEYNWINYSTSIGVDYIYSSYFNAEAKRSFGENILNNQVDYNINIFKPTRSGFTKILEF